MKKSWYSIEPIIGQSPASRPVAAISIHDVIGYGGASVKDFATALSALGEVERIDVSLHSPGGVITEGWGIYNILKAHPAQVHMRVEGLAASMASVILMAADHVEIPSNAYVMIHDPSWMGFNADELREFAAEITEDFMGQAELLEKMKSNIVSAYAARTGQDEETLSALMAKETWLDGAEAVELGFADVLLADQKAAACAPGWSDFLGEHLPPTLEFSSPKKSGLLARLLGVGNEQPEGSATEADALRAQLASAAEALVAAQDHAKTQQLRADDAEAIRARAELALSEALGKVTALEAAQQLFDQRVGDKVRDELAALGVPENRVLPPAHGDLGDEDTVESLTAKLAETTDPAKRYALQTRINSMQSTASKG